jgi:hypothetical protein
MNCIEFEQRLNDQFGPAHFEEALDLAEHAGQCHSCRQALEQFRLVSDALALWRDQVPEVDLTDAVVARCVTQPGMPAVLEEIRPVIGSGTACAEPSRPCASGVQAGIIARSFAVPEKGPRAVWLTAGTIAALAVAILSFFAIRDDGRQPIPQPQLAGNDDRNPDLPVKVNTPLETEQAKPEVPEPLPAGQGAVYYELAQKAAGALDEVSAFVMSVPPMPPAESGTGETGGWIDGLQDQLQPIGRGLDDAFEFLWQAGQSADSSQL